LVDRLALNSAFYYYTPFRLGVCLPSECNVDDVELLANSVGKRMLMKGQAVKCEGQESLHEKLTTHQIIAL
ncbi:nose resistant to fluoxetine protein 6-like protein, partial [Leptotrombidium deliense]